MKFTLGDMVVGSAYIRKSGNRYEYDGQEPTMLIFRRPSGEGVEIEDCHSCDRFKEVEAHFGGVYVGTTTLCTRLNAEWRGNQIGEEVVYTYCDAPERFAVVYYANNKKRYVPLNKLGVDESRRTLEMAGGN